MFAKTKRRLDRIEAALEDVKDALAGLGDTVNLKTPGGLSVVAANAADAKTAAESAFVGMQTLASQAATRPGLPELTQAVSAHTDALRSVQAAVKAIAGSPPAAPAPGGSAGTAGLKGGRKPEVQ